MRRLILQEFLTIDGLAAGAGDNVDFVPASTEGDQSLGQRQLEFIDSIDLIVLGRVTYQLFADYWPNVTSGEDKPFADKLNAIPKLVFSRTLEHAPWGRWDNARVSRAEPAAEMARLKREAGKDMVMWGSISLAQSLGDAGAIDEYQLIICPLVLGEGRRLFADATEPLRLLDTRTFDRGNVLLTYATAAKQTIKVSET